MSSRRQRAVSARWLVRCGALIALIGAGLVLTVALASHGSLTRHDIAVRLAARMNLMWLVDRIYVAQMLDAASLQPSDGNAGPDKERPDVLLIVLDTVRRDRLPIYGYESDTMPRLSQWASAARVYTQARSTSSWTLPAHASLFTGLYPSEHGAHGAAYTPGDSQDSDAYALPHGVPTIASALHDAGYTTVGIAANKAYLGRAMGLARGFDAWLCDDVPSPTAYAAADRVTSMALQVVRTLRPGPLFLFLNYMDAHQPISIREGYTKDAEGVDRELLPSTQLWQQQTRRLMEEHAPLPRELVESWSRGYDGELRFLDEHLARLLEGVRVYGIDENDLVIILSDHGELFGEHDLVEHSKHLYEDLARIPLIVRGPGFQQGVDARGVQIQDIPAWILDAAGVERLSGMTPTGSLQVMELYWTRHKDLDTEPLRERFDRVLRAFVRDGRKLFIDDRGRETLYDLTTDPREESPLRTAAWEAGLRSDALAWLRARQERAGREREPTEHEVENLRSLGYME